VYEDKSYLMVAIFMLYEISCYHKSTVGREVYAADEAVSPSLPATSKARAMVGRRVYDDKSYLMVAIFMLYEISCYHKSTLGRVVYAADEAVSPSLPATSKARTMAGRRV